MSNILTTLAKFKYYQIFPKHKPKFWQMKANTGLIPHHKDIEHHNPLKM